MPTLSNHGHVQTQAIGYVLHSYPAVSARVSRIMVKLATDPLNLYEQYASQATSWPPDRVLLQNPAGLVYIGWVSNVTVWVSNTHKMDQTTQHADPVTSLSDPQACTVIVN